MRLVSAVVTTRNSARTLESCLRSLEKQQDVRVEIIVVDNGSSDATPQIAEKFGAILLQQGPERSAQRNAGIHASQGDVVAIIDSDMILSDHVLAQAVSLLDSGYDAVAMPEISFGIGFWADCKTLERGFHGKDPVVAAARVFRRDDLVAAGGYDELMTGPEDWDLSMRIAKNDRQLAFTTAIIYHDEGRQTIGNLFRKKIYYGKSMPYFIRKHGHAGLRRINPLRPSLWGNTPTMMHKPSMFAGVVIMKGVEMFGGLIGMIYGAPKLHRRIYSTRAER